MANQDLDRNRTAAGDPTRERAAAGDPNRPATTTTTTTGTTETTTHGPHATRAAGAPPGGYTSPRRTSSGAPYVLGILALLLVVGLVIWVTMDRDPATPGVAGAPTAPATAPFGEPAVTGPAARTPAAPGDPTAPPPAPGAQPGTATAPEAPAGEVGATGTGVGGTGAVGTPQN